MTPHYMIKALPNGKKRLYRKSIVPFWWSFICEYDSNRAALRHIERMHGKFVGTKRVKG